MACYLLMAGNKVCGGERREEAGRNGKRRRKGGEGKEGMNGTRRGRRKENIKKVKIG